MDKPAAYYKAGFVTSADGTKIGYREMGNGPGLILVHGGLQSSQSFMQLAGILSDTFTVYIPDRRGRGMSGPFGHGYSIWADCQDMQALIHHTKAQNIFGLSSGAVIVLQTAIIEPALKKVALYEPPIIVGRVQHTRMDKEYDDALAAGNLAKAMISVIKGTGEPSLLTALPVFVTAPFINRAIEKQQKNIKSDEVALKTLIPTFHYDRIIVSGAKSIINESKGLKAAVLLLGGSKSQQFLRMALDELNAALPAAKRVEFKGLGHIAAANGNQPGIVAAELKAFFKE